MRSIRFYSIFLFPGIVLLGVNLGGGYHYLTIAFTFFILPFIDHWVGLDENNPSPEDVNSRVSDLAFLIPTLLFVPVQAFMVIWGAYYFTHSSLSLFESIGFILGVGVVTGAGGINLAHEFMHKKAWWKKRIADFLLFWVSYMHFSIEHVLGHHVKVATPADPATALKNESLFAFIPRSCIGGYASAWFLEKKRLKGNVWTIKNRMLWYAALFVGALFGLYLLWGAWAVVFFIAQSAFAIFLLESTNYVEHYGLLRAKQGDKYAKVSKHDSWNTPFMVSNAILFQLQRHSHHHNAATLPYQNLRHEAKSPQLPSGYPGMILLALVPPLWFKTMNPRLRHRGNH